MVHEKKIKKFSKKICEKLKEKLSKKMFEINISAAIGRKIIAKERIRALRKNVISKCYGGDITRKKKLIEKQKEGKKKIGKNNKVKIMQKTLLSIIKI